MWYIYLYICVCFGLKENFMFRLEVLGDEWKEGMVIVDIWFRMLNGEIKCKLKNLKRWKLWEV